MRTKPSTAAIRSWSRARRIAARVVFLLVALVSVVLVVYVALGIAAAQTPVRDPMTWIHIGVLALDAVGCVTIIVYDFVVATRPVKLLVRATLFAVIVALLIDVGRNGIELWQLYYLLQAALIIGFETATDDELRRGHRLRRPWERGGDPKRRGYIPLNFFNLFWVFLVASIVGLGIEVLWRLLTVGALESRAGLLWGPFSPIYGFGALLMTIALNRWWNSPKTVIVLVSALIGGAFEFAVSWWMEYSFGIIAWDYSKELLNIDGRTDLAHCLAWGLLGLVWIRLLLPDLLELVERIPLTWRAALTVATALFIIVDACMTLLVLDRWQAREAGAASTSAIDAFIDSHYDDRFMQTRFETMTIGDKPASPLEVTGP